MRFRLRGAEETALLVVDPYNDFLSEGGKLWPDAEETARRVGLLDHMREALAATRARGIDLLLKQHSIARPGSRPTGAFVAAAVTADTPRRPKGHRRYDWAFVQLDPDDG